MISSEKRKGFADAVQAVRDGKTTFDEFARETRDVFETIAGRILKSWSTPEWVEPEDVVQDLLLGAWLGIWAWEAGWGGRVLGDHVRYSAFDRAKKRVHKARGALLHGNSDVAPSCFEIRFGRIPGDELSFLEKLHREEALQEERVEVRETIDRIKWACRTREETLAVEAVGLTQSLVAGAELIYRDVHIRTELRLKDFEHAYDVVTQSACKVALRIDAA